MHIKNNKDFLSASACARVLATAGYVSAVKFDLLSVYQSCPSPLSFPNGGNGAY